MPRFIPLILAAFALVACTATQAAPDGGIPLRTRPIALLEKGEAEYPVGRLRFRGALELNSRNARFGGYSALHVSADGTGLLAISDTGHVLRAALHYNAVGWLADMTAATLSPLAGPDGRPVAGTRLHDAEALAADGDDFVVGWEGPARLWRYPGGALDAAPVPIALPPAALNLPANRQIETVARLGPGRFLVLAEAPAAPGRGIGWIGGAAGWRKVDYALSGQFVPVDAAAAPDGDVFVLERRFSWVGGLASRLVRVPAAQLGGDRLEPEELAVIEPPFVTDNFEGLALRRGARGETLLYLISDDNFHPLQRTLLVLLAYGG